MLLHNDTIEQVRERASIVDQFDGKLKRVGAEFVAQCPWHNDKRPSLTISPRTNRAYCFVCAKGVDSIGWIQDREGLSFSDAVISLAERYNVEVKAANEEDAAQLEAERQERAQLMAEAKQRAERFHEAMWTSPAFDYLLERGIEVETMEEWQLGWNGERVMIPLRNPQGQVVGFTGRALGEQKPKYKNSKNSLVFNKSEMVFGLDRAREEIVKSGQVVVVEGQFDVLSCWQQGIRNMVAVSGSSLTKGMIERLVKQTKVREIVLCFDGDLGGLKAADRALRELQELILRGELGLRILTLSEGDDPDSLAATMADLIVNAPHWVEWWFEREVGKIDLNDPQQITQAEAGVKRILQVLPKGGLREYVQRRSKAVLKAVPDVAPAKIKTQRQIDKCAWAERRAFRLYLLDPGSRPALGEISYRNHKLAKLMEVVRLVEGLGTEAEKLAAVLLEVARRDEELSDELRPLARPIPEVLRVIQKNPLGELQGALDVLLSECCQSSDTD